MSPDDPWEPSGDHGRTRAPAGARSGRGRGRSRRRGGRIAGLWERPGPTGPVVRRTVRHLDPWSVLKISLLFHAALFLIICVASALLWSGARASGTLGNVESFITSVGGFGNCEPIEGATPTTTSTTTTVAGEVDQLNPAVGPSPEVDDELAAQDDLLDDDEDCPAGSRLVGEFEFEDTRILQAFAFGGVVLLLAGTGATVVMVLLFNLISDLTGGVQVTVVEDDPQARRRPPAGSPPPRRGG